MTHETCAACGFDGAAFDDAALRDALSALGEQWRHLIGSAAEHLRSRPAPDVWSALEYAAHTRDILALHVFGVEQALTGDEPHFPEVEPGLADAAAATYGALDADEVVAALARHASALAATDGDWSRGLTIGQSRRDVRSLLEHALHDAQHHLDDVRRGLAALSG